MIRKVLIAGLMGWLVLAAWGFIVNGIFGLQAKIDLNHLEAERQVYRVLQEHVVEPGRYVVNPELTEEQRFPEGEPVFSVLYGGVGHESAGNMMLLKLATNFLAVLIATWMLSMTSDLVLTSYPRKVMFFSAIGLLFALFADVGSYGIGGYPSGTAAMVAVSHVAMWTAVGLVVAWRLRPQ